MRAVKITEDRPPEAPSTGGMHPATFLAGRTILWVV